MRFVCCVIVSLFGVPTLAFADEQKDTACATIIEILDQPLEKPVKLENTFRVLEGAAQALVLDCPISPPEKPVEILKQLIDPLLGYLAALELGVAYEFGLGVEKNPETAKLWYLRYILSDLDKTKAHWGFARTRISQFHPLGKNLTEAEFSDSFLTGDLTSLIFEGELARIQNLRNGPIENLVTVIDQFYNSEGAFPADAIHAAQALNLLAREGHPEALFALGKGILERRFEPWNKHEGSIRAQAQSYLIKAAAKQHVPALMTLADLCADGTISGDVSAIAFYQLAAEQGAQAAIDNLRRLRSTYPDAAELWLDEATQGIKAGSMPPCR